jgi:hypothetical protein
MILCMVRHTVLNSVQRWQRCVKPDLPGNLQVGTQEHDPSVMYQTTITILDHPRAVVVESLVQDHATKCHPVGKNRNSTDKTSITEPDTRNATHIGGHTAAFNFPTRQDPALDINNPGEPNSRPFRGRSIHHGPSKKVSHADFKSRVPETRPRRPQLTWVNADRNQQCLLSVN